jgi:peptidoglycan/LPS O-acetylase OafA/YrhL
MGLFRFLLAIAVAIDHAGGLFGYRMISGLFAVQSFYIVSGFLISHILLTKYPDSRNGRWLFYSNRALRIFIPYWTVLVVTVLVSLIGWFTIGNAFNLKPWLIQFVGLNVLAKVFLLLENVFISGQDVSLWLVVDSGHLAFAFDALSDQGSAIAFNVIAPAWTIALELMFYAIAPFLVRRRVAVLLAIFITTQAVRFLCYRAGLYNSALDYRFFPFEMALFVLGILSYRLYQQIAYLMNDRSAVVATAALAICVLVYPHSRYLLAHQYQYYLFVALALPFLFSFTRRRPLDRAIGEMSYTIYLVHWPIQEIIEGLNPAVPPGGWLSVLSIALTCVVAWVLLTVIIAPLDRWRSRRVLFLSQPTFAATPEANPAWEALP